MKIRTTDHGNYAALCTLVGAHVLAFILVKTKTCFRKHFGTVFIFCVLVVFVFKTDCQTPCYSSKTRFPVLETENLFSKQVSKQAQLLYLVGK